MIPSIAFLLLAFCDWGFLARLLFDHLTDLVVIYLIYGLESSLLGLLPQILKQILVLYIGIFNYVGMLFKGEVLREHQLP